jgi:Spy/CpxP family protein refolding chaperone
MTALKDNSILNTKHALRVVDKGFSATQFWDEQKIKRQSEVIMRFKGNMVIPEELDLSKEQTKAISAIKKETRQKMQELKKQKKAIPNIRKLNPTKDDYMEKVKDVAEKSGEIAQEFVTLIAEQRIEIYKVLNKEQQKQLLSLEKKPVKMHKKHQCKYDKKHKELSAPKQTLLEPAKKCKDTHQCDDSKACH